MGVTIVTGLDAGRKREYLVSEFVKSMGQYSPSDILLLAPNFHFLKDIRFSLMQSTGSTAIHPPDMYTFINLAEKIVNSSGLDIRRIEGQLSRSILRSIIDEAWRNGDIPSLGGSATVKGFTAYVDNFLYTLKQCEVDPGIYFGRIKNKESALRDMFFLYDRYQAFLAGHNLYDDSGIFWQAHEILRGGGSGIPQYKKIFIYGFTSFTYIQKRILARLIDAAEAATVFIECESKTGRPILFAEPERLRKFFGKSGAEIISFEPESSENAGLYDYIRSNLFKPGSCAGLPEEQAGKDYKIEITAAADRTAEAETIARDVKRLIVREDYTPDDIIISVPDIEEGGQIYSSVFDEAGIPYHLNSERFLSENSIFSFLEKYIRCAADDFRREDVKNIIASRYFHTLAAKKIKSTDIDFGKFLLKVEKIIEDSAIISGYSEWKKYLEGLINGDQDTETKTVASALLEVIKLGANLIFTGDSAATIEALDKIIDPLEIAIAGAGQGSGEELFTLQQCREAAGKDLKTLAEMFPAKSRNDLLEAFLYITRSTVIRQPGDSSGRVVITNQYDIRGRRPRVLFLAGMNDGLFPQSKNENRIPFKDELLSIAPELGERLPDELPYQEDQMILFFQVISSAQDRIFISYREGGDAERSIFIDDLLELTGPRQERTGLSFDQSPTADKVLSERQLARLVRISGHSGDLPGLTGAAVEVLKADLVTTQEFSDVQQDREKAAPLDNYDGVLRNPDALAIISSRHNADYEYSASYLEAFGKCPFRFFCEKILHIKAKDEKSDELSAMDEGTFYHWVLREFYTCTVDELRSMNSPGALDFASFDEKVDEIIKELEDKIRGSSKVLDTDYWNITLRKYKSNIKRFIRFDLKQMGEFLPLYCELAFGSSAEHDDSAEGSSEEPFTFDLGGIKVLINGKVDRVDLAGSDGSYNVRVVDYKSGDFVSFGDIVKGTALQMQLYTLILGTLVGLLPEKPASVEAAYRSIRKLKYSKTPLTYQDGGLMYKNDDYFPALKKIIEVFVQRITSGFYPPLISKGACEYCDFKNTCFFDEERLSAKLNKTEVKIG